MCIRADLIEWLMKTVLADASFDLDELPAKMLELWLVPSLPHLHISTVRSCIWGGICLSLHRDLLRRSRAPPILPQVSGCSAEQAVC